MNIGNVILDLKAQRNFGKTPKGRSINDKATSTIEAILYDTKNYAVEAVKCLNCGIILSSLLIEKGCPNCGNSDLTTIINPSDTIKGAK